MFPNYFYTFANILKRHLLLANVYGPLQSNQQMKYVYLFLSFILMSSSGSAQDILQDIRDYRTAQANQLKKSANGPIGDEYMDQLHYFEPDAQFKVWAEVEYLYNEPSFRMPTSDGTSKQFKRYAVLRFQLKGQPLQLCVYENADRFQAAASADYLFLPFLDLTTGESTYESGRYLDLKKQNFDKNRLLLDFNKAYNPYCAYSSGYRCPQPPQENFLNTMITAGEKKYTGPKNQKEAANSMAYNFTEKEKELILAGAKDESMYVLQTTVSDDSLTLRNLSIDLKFDDPLLETLKSRMLATVQDPAHPGVGIAAPQVGINKSLIWVQRFDKADQPFEAYLNPKIIWRSKLLRKGAEGCLSIPEVREDVLRSYAIKLQHTAADGRLVDENIEGFTAVIFQHEVDHLYGILFPDRTAEQLEQERLILEGKLEFSIPKGALLP